MTQVFLSARCHTEMGQRVVITGSDPVLGSWDPRKSQVELATDSASYPCWTGAIAAPPGTALRFKLAVLDRDGRARWEDDVADRWLGFPDADVQLSMGFNDPRTQVTTCAELAARVAQGLGRTRLSPPQPPAAAAETAAPGRCGEPQGLECLVREALLLMAETSRRAERSDSRARRAERLIEVAEMRAAVAERSLNDLQARLTVDELQGAKLALDELHVSRLALDELQGARADRANEVRAQAKLQAKLAHDELHGAGADLVCKVRAQGDIPVDVEKMEREARAAETLRRFAGYSPHSDDPSVFRRKLSCGSDASYTSDFGGAAGGPP